MKERISFIERGRGEDFFHSGVTMKRIYLYKVCRTG
jgi:hypothetical protein